MDKVLLKLEDVEITQSKRGTLSISANDKTAAMFDLAARIFEMEEREQRLRAQLQSCVNHLVEAKRKCPTAQFDKCIESASKALCETLNT